MLGKLIKHEMKAVSKLLLPLHVIMLVISIIGVIYIRVTSLPQMASSQMQEMFTVLLLVAYVLAMFAIVVITYMYLYILRPHKMFFKDPSYLMHTLPVSKKQLLLSKNIVLFIWTIIDTVVLAASIIILIADQVQWASFWAGVQYMLGGELENQLGISAGLFFTLTVISGIAGIFHASTRIDFSMAVGHSNSSQKVLYSIITFIGISMALGIVSAIFGSVISLSMNTGISGPTISGSLVSARQFGSYYTVSFVFSIVMNLVLTALWFFGADYFMTKKLNLE